MAKFAVTQEIITVNAHPNADRLEQAQVGLYKVVVPKDAYKTGDKVLYIPEASVLPETLISTLGLTGKLSGKERNRVKAITLRGVLSQGLVAPLTVLPDGTDMSQDNYANILGITKYEPLIPASMSGNVYGATDLVRWIEIEDIKRYPDTFKLGEQVIVEEKIHGTATLITIENAQTDNPIVFVSSKGLGSKQLALTEDPNNVYWRVIRENNIISKAQEIARIIDTEKLALFGETYGFIQDLHYGKPKTLGFVLFDIKNTITNTWVDLEEKDRLAQQVGLVTPPILYKGEYNINTIAPLAEGKELLSGTQANIREGVVIRPAHEDRTPHGRKIAKYVGKGYLTRKNGTEFN